MTFQEYGESKCLKSVAESSANPVKELLEQVADGVQLNELLGWLSKWIGTRDDSYHIGSEYKPYMSTNIMKSDSGEGAVLQKQIADGLDQAIAAMKKGGWTGKYFSVLSSLRSKYNDR